MPQEPFGDTFGANPAENYERFFVPTIGAPAATNLVGRAAIRSGERVLDVACGTGIVARLAADRVTPGGSVDALDVNPAMLAVARASTPPAMSITWHEAEAGAMPFPDDVFDVVLCQMGLQFMPDKNAALEEMRRVLRPGGRILVSMPGPAGPIFELLATAMERHINAEAAGFVRLVFSLHDTSEIEELMTAAGFRDVEVEARDVPFRLPAPRQFLWQYVHSTPLGAVVGNADESSRSALEDSVVAAWSPYEADGEMTGPQRMVVANARK